MLGSFGFVKMTLVYSKSHWFTSIDSRKMMPCFDEPTHKAVFNFTLISEEGLTFLSNSELLSETPFVDGERRLCRAVFAPTLPMSSYLCCVCVGRLNYIEDQTRSHVRLRLYAVDNKAKHSGACVQSKRESIAFLKSRRTRKLGSYMLNVARKALRFLEGYFGCQFPLRKLDLIAVPEMAMLAMENWGAIVFRESRLLIDSSTGGNAVIASVRTLCHEISHMWYGNLVTLEWWRCVQTVLSVLVYHSHNKGYFQFKTKATYG